MTFPTKRAGGPPLQAPRSVSRTVPRGAGRPGRRCRPYAANRRMHISRVFKFDVLLLRPAGAATGASLRRGRGHQVAAAPAGRVMRQARPDSAATGAGRTLVASTNRLLVAGTVAVLAALMLSRHVSAPGSAAPPPAILCLGDSLTAGFVRTAAHTTEERVTFHPYANAASAALGPAYTVVALGFSGWTSSDLLAAADARSHAPHTPASAPPLPGLALALKTRPLPALVIIMAGTNDVFRAANVSALDGVSIAERVWRLHAIAHARSVKTLALAIPAWDAAKRSAVPPITDEMRAEARRALNGRLRGLCLSSAGMAEYMDFPITWAAASEDFGPDGLHLSRVGYERAGREIANRVRRMPALGGDAGAISGGSAAAASRPALAGAPAR
jgi:lysophospholipase L1-like esterase